MVRLRCPITFLAVFSVFSSIISSTSVYQNALVFAVTTDDADSATTILQGYGAPFDLIMVPQEGIALPTLETTTPCNESVGLYGMIIIISQVAYDYGGSIGFASALNDTQFDTLYAYQVKYGVRMVQLNQFPSSVPGVDVVPPGGCCASEEQLVTLTNTDFIPSAGLKSVGLSTLNLFHTPAVVTNSTGIIPFLSFGTNSQFSSDTVGGVVKTYDDGREEIDFFISGGSWSATSNYLGHIWYTWAYRGLYGGYRRIFFSTQVDDLFLTTVLHVASVDSDGPRPRIQTGDLDNHIAWMSEINVAMPPGSDYFMELGFNGNGNEEQAATISDFTCPSAVIRNDPPSPPEDDEFVKPIGTGTSQWPVGQQYVWSSQCTLLDPLGQYFQNTSNRDSFALVSHTFTHEDLDNATYSDAFNEITFNQQHATNIGFVNAARWSPNGLIPPAITGLHNGDALKAFSENGIVHVVGDNTRPALRNPVNQHWPLITTVEANGFAGVQITPRWATQIFFDCSDVDENLDEWLADGHTGNMTDLLSADSATTMANLMSLYQDPFMFHQANLRVTDVAATTVNGITKQRSLLQMWVETVVGLYTAAVNWPMVTKKHDDLAAVFMDRMTRDQCNPTTRLIYSADGTQIIAVEVGADGNTCSVPVPITIPSGTVTSLQGSTTEQIGGDPLTVWVTLNGNTKVFSLTSPITLK